MMRLVAPLALAACGDGDNAAETEATLTAAATMPMNNANMPMSTGTAPMAQGSSMNRSANAVGTVTGVHNQAGTISIKHGAVAAVNWPVMTMAFKTDSTIRQQVAVGDKVAFSLQLSNGSGQLTAISKE